MRGSVRTIRGMACSRRTRTTGVGATRAGPRTRNGRVLPNRLIRVEWQAAYGWPEPERRYTTARNFASVTAAGRQLAAIERLPSHCRLLGVWETACDWHVMDDALIERVYDEEVEDERPEVV